MVATRGFCRILSCQRELLYRLVFVLLVGSSSGKGSAFEEAAIVARDPPTRTPANESKVQAHYGPNPKLEIPGLVASPLGVCG